jgi:transglutaminase-like putative cysteine protease
MTKKYVFITVLLFVIAFAGCSGSSDGNTTGASSGYELYDQAVAQEKAGNYYAAFSGYEMALSQFRTEKNDEMAAKCRDEKFRLKKILVSYPLDINQIKTQLSEQYTDIPMDVKQTWITKDYLEYLFTDGKKMYFGDAVTNVLYRHPEYFSKDSPVWNTANSFRKPILDMIASAPPYDGNPYINPVKFKGTFSVNAERSKFPKNGSLKVWVPFPINTDCQKDIKIVTIEPAEFHKSGPDVNAALGNVYFEFPLDKLKTDVAIKVEFTYSSYQQNYEIDPLKVGEYDKTGSLYLTYTTSAGNITYTPEIKAKAQEIVGQETNPYLQAKMLYDYVISNIDYSLMPHLSIEQMGIPESVYVHTHNYGDCGSQSMYLSALCRSIGIPARATGGYQNLTEGGSGHFWGEIYLPNYGWVPNDTTLAEMMTLSPFNQKRDDETIRNFYSVCLDARRLVIQKDVDLPLSPPMTDNRFMKCTLQTAQAECYEMDDDPNWIIVEGFKSSIVPVD